MTDVAKASQALSRPGIDPRKFVDVGIVTAVAVGRDGIVADISTHEAEETVSLSPPYAGPGYGFHLPIDLDHAALIALPDGKWNAGGRIVGATWDAGSPPPGLVIDNPDDVVLVVKPGQSLRIAVTGGGSVDIKVTGGADVVVSAGDGGKVRLGGEGVESPPMTNTDGSSYMTALNAAIIALSASPVSQAALAALQTALQAINWPTGATSVTVK